MILWFCVLMCFIVTLGITAWLRRYAVAKAIFDMPNARSSHTVPTPRGGGLAIVVVFLFATLSLYGCKMIPISLMLALVGGGVLVALIGYCDDRRSLAARWRFLAHLLAAVWVLYCLNGFPVLDFGVVQCVAPWLGAILALIAIIWSINLYNFMDGIDGCAGAEGLFLSISSAVFFLIVGDSGLAVLSFCLAATIGGFLYWNWPPAKIFLGDVGSGFLGFVFIVLAIHAANQHHGSLVFWLLLFALFLYDATFTLIYRVSKKQKWYQAHREHAYQKGVDAGWDHQKMTLCMLLINVVVLLPAAMITYYYPAWALMIWGCVSLCLIVLWFKARRFKNARDDG